MTNLIVISNETDLDNEAAIVNDLFHAGLGLFHLRKPAFTLEQQCDFLYKIEKQFLNKVSVHQNYETVLEFDLKYYHVKEKDRHKLTPAVPNVSSSRGSEPVELEVENNASSGTINHNGNKNNNPHVTLSGVEALTTLKNKNIKRSTSFHNYNDLQFESHYWDYCFFGPVFDSISKTGYKSNLKEDFHNESDLYQRVFALGGITKENIEEVFKKEFFGAAVLGSVWKDPANAVKNFIGLNKLCKQNVHTY